MKLWKSVLYRPVPLWTLFSSALILLAMAVGYAYGARAQQALELPVRLAHRATLQAGVSLSAMLSMNRSRYTLFAAKWHHSALGSWIMAATAPRLMLGQLGWPSGASPSHS